MSMKKYKSVDEYIDNYPEKTQSILKKMRQTIQAAAPEAVEGISYGIPTFKLKGNLVHFGAYSSHAAFYPGASGVKNFEQELREYETSKGTIRFSLEKPIPYSLIAKITKFRVLENTVKK